jgi:hypothetical protein
MTYTFDESILSDLHKEAYGYRPAAAYYDAWSEMADFAKQAEWDRLVRLVKEEYERERLMEDLAHERWSAHLAQLMADDGIDYATALRWDMAAMDAADDAGYYCFKWGISYSLEADINEVLKKEFI